MGARRGPAVEGGGEVTVLAADGGVHRDQLGAWGRDGDVIGGSARTQRFRAAHSTTEYARMFRDSVRAHSTTPSAHSTIASRHHVPPSRPAIKLRHHAPPSRAPLVGHARARCPRAVSVRDARARRRARRGGGNGRGAPSGKVPSTCPGTGARKADFSEAGQCGRDGAQGGGWRLSPVPRERGKGAPSVHRQRTGKTPSAPSWPDRPCSTRAVHIHTCTSRTSVSTPDCTCRFPSSVFPAEAAKTDEKETSKAKDLALHHPTGGFFLPRSMSSDTVLPSRIYSRTCAERGRVSK